jgi:S-adenosylmethionine:tRNA ribosyltransferase-isomerase
MKLELFQYDLPSNFIAQEPIEKRDHSKMLLLERKTGQLKHDYFYNIINYLASGDIIVVNESKVQKCRICGKKEKTGAIIECFLLQKLSNGSCLVLLRPSKRIKQKDRVIVGRYYYDILEKLEYGKAVVKFIDDVEIIINEYGKVPLPPYIKNEEVREERYQTIYASKTGSAAAPTAGFHFTEKLIADISGRGIKFAKLTLDIGLDTFRPVVEEEIEEHVIHSESYFLSDEEALKINEAKKRNGRIIAVGTTTTRVLETIANEYGCIKGASGKTSLYIYPGYKFKTIDALVTNFHLPGSTLIIMVSAFAGRDNILHAYEEAKNNNYRFFSFGDCMFIN